MGALSTPSLSFLDSLGRFFTGRGEGHLSVVSGDTPSLSVQNLSVFYNRREMITDLSGTFAPHSMTAIVGPNGSGKSTLLKTLLGIHSSYRGTITYQGAAPEACAYLAQQTTLDRQFPLTVMDTVALGLFQKVGLWRGIDESQRQKIAEALAKVGLEGTEDKPLQALSGGQFQRVLFARLILQNAPIIFLDEPFTGVDEQTVEDLLELIKEWHREGRLIICVLHDMDIVRAHFPETLVMARRSLAWGATAEALTRETLTEAKKQARSWERL